MSQLSDQKKAKIREMREKGASYAVIQAEVKVNSKIIKECCEDMGINQRCKNPLQAEVLQIRDTLPVKN